MKKCKACVKKKIRLTFSQIKVKFFPHNRWRKIRIRTFRKKDWKYLAICKHCHKTMITDSMDLGTEFKLGKNYYDYDNYNIKLSDKKIKAHKNKYYVYGPAIQNFIGKNKHLFSRHRLGSMYKNKAQAIIFLKKENKQIGKGQRFFLYNHKGMIRNIN